VPFRIISFEVSLSIFSVWQAIREHILMNNH
jgi:hypothetical protein